MGLLYGEYGGRSDGFQPGGASYETGFCPHGGSYEAQSLPLIIVLII
jgi:homogentisate 1,2-dioxygenase